MTKGTQLKLLYWALAVGGVLLLLKFGAWAWTNSNTILTDALESIINIVAGGFALFSLSLALKPKDEDHPYGHGKIEFISAGFEGALILIAGIGIISKAIWDMFHLHEVQGLDVGVIITAVAGGTNYFMGRLLVKRGRKLKSITMEASGEHLQSDAYSSVGLIVGLGIVWATGIDMLDNVLAIVFGIVIMVTGYGLVRRSIAGIMDEADEDLILSFVEEIEGHREADWIDVHNLRVIKYGSNLHMDCHLTLPWYYDTRQSHDRMKDFEDMVKELSERPVELFIHVDPCEPISCHICQKMDCPKRQHPKEKRIKWTVENITTNRKHNH
jgi:cation diffusion facilitator family transporter